MAGVLNRRGFLGSLFGAAAIAADPEKLLWVPGAKKIFIPPASVPLAFTELSLEFRLAEDYARAAWLAIAEQIDRDCFRFYRGLKPRRHLGRVAALEPKRFVSRSA